MKKPLYLLAAAMLMLASCSKENDVAPGFGKLAINASVTPEVTFKATIDQSVVNNYNLTITSNSDKSEKFNGTIASFASPMELPAGTYTAVVKSEDFTTPAFSKPVYGVTKSDITVASNQTTEATLQATQTNAGVKVAYDAQMATSFPGKTATTTITDANGSLIYASDESRIGYFTPGAVTVKVTFDGKEYTQSLTLAAGKNKEITVNITPKPATPSLFDLKISVDETFDAKVEDWTFDEKPYSNLKLEENFTGLTGFNTTSTGASTPWTGNENFPTLSKDNSTAPKTTVYMAGDAIKLGSSSLCGWIESKSLDLSANNGNVKVRFKVKGWLTGGTPPTGTSSGSIDVTIGGITVNVPYAAGTNVNDFQTIEASFTNGAANQTVKIATKDPKRAFIDDVQVLN